MKSLETNRLILREFVLADIIDYYEMAKNPNVGNNGGWEPHSDIIVTEGVVQTYIVHDNAWAIVSKEDCKVIGSISFKNDVKRRVPSANMIGYSLSEDYWGRGLMTEAVKRVIQYAFEDSNSTVVSIYHFSFNERSKRVIEKCGFIYEGRMRCSYQMYDGNIYDDFCYSILKEEYFLNHVLDNIK